jgi:rare lipoprotein A
VKLASLVALVLVLFLAACGGHKQAKLNVPPPPPVSPPTELPPAKSPEIAAQPKAKSPNVKEPAQGTSAESESQDRANEERAEQDEQKLARAVPEDAAPLEVQTGIASWYGPPYHNRRGSNGEIYNMNLLRAG